jgi:hypothetical protein
MEVLAVRRSSLALAIIGLLVFASAGLLAVRTIHLHDRGPIKGPPGTPIVYMKKWSCTGPNTNVIGACAESWWEHFWDGLPYCDDAESDCILYGGTFKLQ